MAINKNDPILLNLELKRYEDILERLKSLLEENNERKRSETIDNINTTLSAIDSSTQKVIFHKVSKSVNNDKLSDFIKITQARIAEIAALLK